MLFSYYLFLFFSNKRSDEESEWEAQERRRASRCIWMMGKKGLTEYEAAVLIIHEAKQYLQVHGGGGGAHHTGGQAVPTGPSGGGGGLIIGEAKQYLQVHRGGGGSS